MQLFHRFPPKQDRYVGVRRRFGREPTGKGWKKWAEEKLRSGSLIREGES